MDEILSITFLNNTLEQWLIAAAFILGGFIAGKIIALIFSRILSRIFKKGKHSVKNPVTVSLKRPLALLVFLLGTVIGVHRLNLNQAVLLWTDRIVNTLLIIIVTWALTKLANSLIARLIPHDEKTHFGKSETRLQPLLQKFTDFVLWLIAVTMILRTMSYNVSALMAGLGLGGAALALASKDTLSNIFGSFTVFLDRPFRLNDRIKIGNYEGVITDMRIRTSRLRTPENRTVFIPNSLFAAQPIENISAQPNIKVTQTIGIKGDNGYEKIERGLEIIREIATSEKGLEGKAIISLVSVGGVTCMANFVYYVSKKADYNETVTRVNMDILRRFEEEGIMLA